MLCEKCNIIFNEIRNKAELNQLEKRLNKIGLTFENKKNFFYLDEQRNRWKEVSMIERSQYRMPSTTNQIECKHGHLNDETPKNNGFIASLYRLIVSLNNQVHQFNRNMYKNYKKVTNDVINKSRKNNIENQCDFYNSTQENCECGEVTLYSSMFQLDIPCPHRFFLGAQFPDLEDIDCNFSNQFEYEDLILDILKMNSFNLSF